MSSTSPEQGGSRGSFNSPDAGDQSKDDPSSFNLNFLKNLADRRNPRGDGSQPKKRGPKPDSKPALTRRQELNRQAQRTHRERKELYIKALEDEVLRLKEVYSSASQDKTQLAEENKYLRDLLAQHGIPFPDASIRNDSSYLDIPHGHISNTSGSASAFSPGVASQSSAQSASSASQSSHQKLSGQQLQGLSRHAQQHKGLDYEQAGIDFVLTYDEPSSSSRAYLSPPPQ